MRRRGQTPAYLPPTCLAPVPLAYGRPSQSSSPHSPGDLNRMSPHPPSLPPGPHSSPSPLTLPPRPFLAPPPPQAGLQFVAPTYPAPVLLACGSPSQCSSPHPLHLGRRGRR